MPGFHVLYLWCKCGHEGEVRARREWELLTRDKLLVKFKCSVCGKRPVEMRRVWVVPTGEQQPGSDSTTR